LCVASPPAVTKETNMVITAIKAVTRIIPKITIDVRAIRILFEIRNLKFSFKKFPVRCTVSALLKNMGAKLELHI
jgi:hypothetical protein